MITIGLTGGIGSGKSTVAALFREFGITVLSADHFARLLVEPNMPCHTAITQHFGTRIVRDDDQIDRAKLRQIIFDNPNEKAWLEALLHPPIRQQIELSLKNVTSAYCVIEIPLLTPGHAFSYLDRILVVDCSQELQIIRAQHRDNLTPTQIRQIIDHQLSRPQRLQLADDVIINDGSLQDLHQAVENMHSYYLSLVG